MEIKYYLVSNRASVQEPMLIGEARCRRPFLFHTIEYERENPFTGETIRTFEQWMSVIEKAVKSGEAVIMDEFDEVISLEIFIRESCNYCGYRFSQD